jgi:hypothetical protein
MKLNIITKLFCFLTAGSMLTSCLEGDEMNTPPGVHTPIVQMTYVQPGGTLINTGLRYFGAQALLLSPADDADTVTFAVTVQGPVKQDVTVTLEVKPEHALDNLPNDGVEYSVMTPDQYKFLSTSATIPQGKTSAEFQIVFYPPNMDFSESTILPITASNDAGLTTSSNYGLFYPHVIGNAIAGVYDWQFIRYSNPQGTGSPDATSFTDETVFSPVDPTTVLVPTGYYTQPNYIITFDNDNGVLSNFKAVIDPAAVAADWDPAGIVIATGPTITVSPDYQTFTIKYTTLTRNVTDVYTRK